jgi:hypothetical protein
MIVDLSSTRWNRSVTPPWGVTSGISNVVRQLELSHFELLPDLHLGPTLVVASDYSGQHKNGTHEAFSFLLADLKFCWLWDEKRRHVRKTLLSDERRMSYKGLHDGRRRRALLPFLRAADWIPGVLATVLVDKRFTRSLTLTPEDRLALPATFGKWPTQVIQKLLLVSHLGSLFIAGLSAPAQNIIWFTDNDDFVANDQRVIDLTPFFAGMVGNYSEQQMGHFRFGTTSCDNGDFMIEDLASLPDLAAGALCEIPMQGILPRYSRIQVSARDHLPRKAVSILAWLGEPRQALRRLCFVVDEGDNPGRMRVRALELWPD